MASGADLTAYSSSLKELYPQSKIITATYTANPFFALLPKFEKFGGSSLRIPLIYGDPQGRSRTFGTAQSQSTSTSRLFKDFNLTRVKDYSIATIDNETLEATEGDANAFISAASSEMDGALNTLKRSIGIGCYRDSSGQRGQVSAEPSEAATTVITMKSAGDITNIEVGMTLNIHSAKSGGSQRSLDGSTTSIVVSAVNRSAGTFTCATAYDSSGTIAADDYIFVAGDRGLGLSGLEDWIPATAPSATAFFGVDRTADVERLSGHRLDGSGGPLEEVLAEADAKVAQNGGFMLDHFLMSHVTYKNLKNSLGSKVQYVDLNADPRVSFRGVLVDGVGGPIKCVADFNCPDNRIFGVQLEHWKFYSLGPACKISDADGLSMLRQSSDDGVEIRITSYGNIGTSCPASAINIQI